MNDRCDGCVERRLAAILAADVVGYSMLMERDEEDTFARIRSLRLNIVEPCLAQHRGRLIKTTGDGFLAEFSSPIEALRCALAIQSGLESDPARSDCVIGLNLGDVIIEEGGDVFGEGVNVAARLEALADAGGILISGKLHDEVEGKVEANFEYRGEQKVKNITRLVRVHAVHPREPARHCGYDNSGVRRREATPASRQAFHRCFAVPEYERRS